VRTLPEGEELLVAPDVRPSALVERLSEASAEDRLPAVRAYNRIDGPGSSLDLREFQQGMWVLPEIPADLSSDPSLAWSRHIPRTVAITIDTGTLIQAEPYEAGRLAAQSIEYGVEVSGVPGSIPAATENWLLKIMEAFGLSGVRFVLRNLRDGTHSSGLGGSATATTGTCILANSLAGRPYGPTQLIAMASRMEQDLGVSLTGTQEQSNVLFGGVVDYAWFPWGVPGRQESGYGSSIRSTLLEEADYPELEARMAIFHTGKHRASSDTNARWVRALSDEAEYGELLGKIEAVYAYREGLRCKDWPAVTAAIRKYRRVRTSLCPDYMVGSEEIHQWAEAADAAAFPLGAGGGGGVLVFCEDPDGLSELRKRIGEEYREIEYEIRSSGHELIYPLEND
jgi:galactokinase/mevalonate kinase-like predicted kinase